MPGENFTHAFEKDIPRHMPLAVIKRFQSVEVHKSDACLGILRVFQLAQKTHITVAVAQPGEAVMSAQEQNVAFHALFLLFHGHKIGQRPEQGKIFPHVPGIIHADEAGGDAVHAQLRDHQIFDFLHLQDVVGLRMALFD